MQTDKTRKYTPSTIFVYLNKNGRQCTFVNAGVQSINTERTSLGRSIHNFSHTKLYHLSWDHNTQVNSIKKYKLSVLQVRPLFLQVETNLNSVKVFTSSCYKPPTCTYKWYFIEFNLYKSKLYMHTMQLQNNTLAI